MQSLSSVTGFRVSVPPPHRWNRSVQRAVWTVAVMVVTGIYLLLGIGLVSGLALAVGAVVK